MKAPFSVFVSLHLLQDALKKPKNVKRLRGIQDALKKPENVKRLRGIYEILARKAAREVNSGGEARQRISATRSAKSEKRIRLLLNKLFKG